MRMNVLFSLANNALRFHPAHDRLRKQANRPAESPQSASFDQNTATLTYDEVALEPEITSHSEDQ